MKNEPSFKLVVAIIVAGVIVALAGPFQSSAAASNAAADLTQAAHATE